jgi:tetratricopeptide (TPR) repeat protein
MFFSTYGCATKGDYTKIHTQNQKIDIEGVSILPPQGDGWYFRKEHDGSIRFVKSGKTQDQSLVGLVVLSMLPDCNTKEEFLNIVSEQRARNSQNPRFEIILNDEVLSDEKDNFCVRAHTTVKDFKSKNLPATAGFLLMENIDLICRHPFDKRIAVTIGFSQRALPNNEFRNFESDANEFIKNVILIPFEKTNTAKGYAYLKAKEYKLAIDLLSLAIAEDPADYKAYFFRAVCYDRQKKIPLAISDWEKTISLKKDYAEAYGNLALVYKEMKDYQKALFYTDMAINSVNGLSSEEQIKKEIPETYRIRGEINYELKKYIQAVQDFTEAIELDPRLKSAYMNRGYVYNEQGEYLKATQDFKAVGELYADDATVLNNIAWFYATCKDKKFRNGAQAVNFSLKAVDLETVAYNLDTLGAAYVENKQYEKAIETYKAVIEKDRTFFERYQKSLNEKGCYSGPIDGFYSQEFEKALRNCILQGHYL